MQINRIALFMLLLVLCVPWGSLAQLRNDPFNILPDTANPTMRTNGLTFYGHEDAQREGRHFSSFVYSGGLHAASTSLTSAAFSTEAFVPERINQVATAITYTTSTTNICWSIISSNNTAIASWNRVGMTAYYFFCQGEGATTPIVPPLPANSTWLMQIFITGGALTTVNDISSRVPVSIIDTTGVHSIRDYGARCNGVTDDSGAFRLAHLVLSAGATLTIPESTGTGIRGCVLASTVTFTKRINIKGFSTDSIIYLTMGTGSDGLVYNAGGTTPIYGPQLENFAILGGLSSARNCLVMRYITVAYVKNVHVFCGTSPTGYAVWLQDFILQSHFHFISNGTYIGYPSVGASPGNGVKATAAPNDTAGTFNANTFDLDITGPGTAESVGLWIYSAGGGGGNNDIRGTYQGWGGDGIFVRGGDHAHIHDAHLEGGDVTRSNRLHVQGTNYTHLGPNILVTAGTPAVNCFIQGASYTVIDGIACDVLRLDSSPSTLLARVSTQDTIGSHIEDASIQTTWLVPAISTGAVRVESGSFMDGSSIAVNGSAERWDTITSAPPGIAAGIGGAATWAREATIVKHGNYSISVTTSAASISGVQILTAAQAVRAAGRKVSFNAWVYVPTGQPDITPYIYLDNGAETGGYNIISTKDAWIQVSGTLNINSSGQMGAGGRTNAKLLFIAASGTSNYYIDAVSVVVSHAGSPIYFTGNPNEYIQYDRVVTINPGIIAANTTVGISVTVPGAQSGHICSLGPPTDIAAGLGWSCVVTAPETVNVRIHNVSAGAITPASANWTVMTTSRP